MRVGNSSIWILSAIFVFFGLQAQASFLTPCELDQLPLPAGTDSSLHKDYIQKLQSECYLQKRYQATVHRMTTEFSASLEDVTMYKAPRYVDHGYYHNAKYYNTPVPYIYQKKKSMYDLPLAQRSTEIWDNWIVGIRQLDRWVQNRVNGVPASLEELFDVHKGFYTLSNEFGDYSNDPDFGQIKNPNPNDNYWFEVKPEDLRDTVDALERINGEYAKLALLPSKSAVDSEMHLPMRTRNLNGKIYLYGGDSRKNAEHLKNLFNFYNTMLAQGSKGQHMVWQGRLFTPGQVALLVQQHFVHIHPFNDGNGRSSRFLQESVLKLFGLPYLFSGYLMRIDLLTPHENYYYVGMGKTFEQFDRIDECMNNVYPRVLFRSKNIRSVPAQDIEYDCRLL